VVMLALFHAFISGSSRLHSSIFARARPALGVPKARP